MLACTRTRVRAGGLRMPERTAKRLHVLFHPGRILTINSGGGVEECMGKGEERKKKKKAIKCQRHLTDRHLTRLYLEFFLFWLLQELTETLL